MQNPVDVGSEDKYRFFHREEPREAEGEVKIDSKTGKRYQWWDIGMVRNASAENRREVKVWLDPIPHITIPDSKPLQGWYKAKFEPPGVRNRPCFTESVLTEPYGGTCPVKCNFCYINAGMRGYRAQGLTTVPENYGQQVRRQLSKWRTSAAGYICSFIDPFLPLEKIYHNSQGCAEAFTSEGLPVYFLSRLEYPGWAYDILKQNKYSYAQMSINTSDPEQWRRLSPWAIKLNDMLDQVKQLHKAGIYVSIQCNPIIAGVTSNAQIKKLIHQLADRGADHIIFKFVETAFSQKTALIDKQMKSFGKEAGQRFADLLDCNIGGQVTINEEYRIEALQEFKKECKKANITMAVCYEYEYERDKSGKIVNKTGVSLGRKFITSEQCHGHRVPLFTRPTPTSRFIEVQECPPTGCLHCADENKGEPRCGNELFGQAGALRSTDYRQPVYENVSQELIEASRKRFPRLAQDLVQIKT